MIFSIIDAGNQMDCLRWSCTTPTKVVKLPQEQETREVCLCSYSATSCTYYELASTDVNNVNDRYKNDYRKFLLNPITTSSSYSFTLIEKDGTEHIIYSNTESSTSYGDVYRQGFNVDQPLQVGVNIIWSSVVSLLGYGDYTVKLSQADFGNEVTSTTHVFRVVKYDAERMNGTIKIEIDNVGVTQNGENWTGLLTNSEKVFTNMVRLKKGRLLLTDPEIEIESIVDGTREDRPTQTTTTDTYSIKIERIPKDLGYSLIHKDIVMNWRITDYNLFGDDFRNKEMIIQSSSVTNIADYDRKSYELTGKSNVSRVNRKFV